MKRRLLAFFLAFAMMVSLMPVSALAEEEEAKTPFTSIVTESGEAVTVEFVETVVGEAAWGEPINTPYYHVTIPEGTENVLVTYPGETAFVFDGSDETNALFFSINMCPGVREITYGGSLPVAVNDDGSKTVTVPVAYFLVNEDGNSTAVGMGYQIDAETRSAIDFLDFTYASPAPVSHTVTLTAGTGYTLTGEDTVEDGADYTFTLSIEEGYEKTEAFAVKANGNALTAEADGTYTVKSVSGDLTVIVEGVAKKQETAKAPFIDIVTESDETVTAEYVETITAESTDGEAITAPLYHVTVPAGTAYALVTYPEDTEFYDAGGNVYWYAVSLPDRVLTRGNMFSSDVNEDGSKLAVISVEDFVLENGAGYAVGIVTRDSEGNPSTPNFFTFEYDATTVVTHTVTLATVEGCVLNGAATVEDGKDYTFGITAAQGYVKSGSFAVKVDGKALAANEEGLFTIAGVTTDVEITVEGIVKKPESGLSELSFGGSSSASAERFQMTPAFDPAVKEYTVTVPDTTTSLYVWATQDGGVSTKGKIEARWINLMSSTGAVKSQTVRSGNASGQSLSGAAISGDKTCTITVKITDGEYSDTYSVTTVRTDPTLKSLSLGSVQLNKTFAAATKAYTATTADESVTVNAEPRGSSYTVTVNGKSDRTVPLKMGENVIEIAVENTSGEKNTYTVTVTRVNAVSVTLNLSPEKAKVTLTDAKGNVITPDSKGVYRLLEGSAYYYAATASGYIRLTGSFTATESGPVTIEMKQDTAKPVTVYFSFSHDEKFELCEETGEVMALKKITVPYFDLANYGMEDFYFHSESYGSKDPDNPGAGSDLEPGTAEFAYGKITMLHLFIYATEVYRCGIDPADAGQGYLLDSGLLGQDIFSYSGSAGSIFLQTIWDYDLNLNYYLNHEYPLASEGWGSTCDQILLHDDDVVTLGHFTDWSFFNDSTSVFNHFESDTAAPVQGDQFTLSVIRDGADMYGTYNTAHTPVTYNPDIYCALADEIYDGDVTTWTYVGTADDEGHLVVDTTDLAPGEYVFAMAGQPGAEYLDAICSTPGGMRITIQAKPVIKGDVDGDGTVNAIDVTALYNALTTGSALDAAVSDINGDGVVDVFDVMALYASIAGGK